VRAWLIVPPLALLCLTLLSPNLRQPTEAAQEGAPAASLVTATQAFLATLDDEQKAKASLAYDADERTNWQFIPLPTRKGLPLMDMRPQQQQAARRVLKAAVSQLGYEKATAIMSLESLLRKLEGPGSEERRNPEKYYFTTYGQVGERWGLSIEGHHLSLNFVLQGDKIIDSTPQFFATNPAELKEGYGEQFPKGLRVIKEEETHAFTLLTSLNEQQRAAVKLPGDTPAEIYGVNKPQPPSLPEGGIQAAKLNDQQREHLRHLLTAYTSKMRPEVAAARWEAIQQAGIEKIVFAWSGADRPGVGHYYYLHCPAFQVEFINVQADAAGNPANHIHCVWRDMDGDFGLPRGN
jgi:hypothetical protein